MQAVDLEFEEFRFIRLQDEEKRRFRGESLPLVPQLDP
jgi:hypothetical protein